MYRPRVEIKEENRNPSERQLLFCRVSGWEYIGDGIFEHAERKQVGWFIGRNFYKESYEV